jgi:hypothetical protein
MTEKCASPRWAWPITLDSYDRNPELSAEEAEKLRANAPSLADGVPPSIVIEKCGFPRLMKPLEQRISRATVATGSTMVLDKFDFTFPAEQYPNVCVQILQSFIDRRHLSGYAFY